NYLQLPVNQAAVPTHTNQEGGSMSYGVDDRGSDPSVNYEPSVIGGLAEADDSYELYSPYVEGDIVKAPIDRTNNYGQAGERYRSIEQWERDDLVLNLVNALVQCDQVIQEKMLDHIAKCDDEFGQRVADGVKNMAEAKS